MEKFVKNYFDIGRTKESGEIEYCDGTLFKGKMALDVESACLYKEGQGILIRPKLGHFSYYSQILGNYSNDVLQSKNTHMLLNLRVFPRGYVQNRKIKELRFTAAVDKGVYSGPATVIIDGKKVCNTYFHD